MLTLTLLRHAKSSWDDTSLDDFERPLNDRGRKNAPLSGKDIARLKLKPDLVLCSSAKRTKETLALLLPELGKHEPEVLIEDELYLAYVTTLLERVRGIEQDAQSVLLVGHNPGLHGFALALIGAGEGEAIAEMADRFPTSAMAVIAFEATKWRDIEPANGRLIHFLTPKR